MPEKAADQFHFADQVVRRTRALGHPLCAGLDPFLDRIPRLFHSGSMRPNDPMTAAAVQRFLIAFLDRAAGKVVAVKPQIAMFERLGWPGMQALSEVIDHAHRLDLPVLLDAKRGDIGSTAENYAAAYLDADSPIAVDAITLNAYLGRDTLAPFLMRAKAEGKALFVLLKTSNPGSADVQNLAVDGRPLFLHLADKLNQLDADLSGPQTGWSNLGVVVGATHLDGAIAARAALPNALFLIPGYGAQGGSSDDAVVTFVNRGHGPEGGLINSSRGLLFPDAGGQAANASAWEAAIDAALNQASDDLGQALARKR